MFTDGGVFDSSYQQGEPIGFPVDWVGSLPVGTKGIQLLQVGDKARL